MVFEGVPWMVDEAEHTAEVGRLLAYAATGNGEGVIGISDCKVVASDIPDGNVHIDSGGVVILNAGAGGGQQSYVVRNVGDTEVALDPQGSSGVRYDLVAIVVEDPEYPGQPAPASIADGPYVRAKVYKDVGPTVENLIDVDPDQTGYVLARVRFDASDGTITASDITDLRELVQPRTKRRTYQYIPTPNIQYYADLSVYYPTFSGSSPIMKVPFWANRATIMVSIDGLQSEAQHWGAWKLVFDTIEGVELVYDVDNSTFDGPVRYSFQFGIVNADVSALQGETLSPEVMLKRDGFLGTNAFFVSAPGMTVTYDVAFDEEPV